MPVIHTASSPQTSQEKDSVPGSVGMGNKVKFGEKGGLNRKIPNRGSPSTNITNKAEIQSTDMGMSDSILFFSLEHAVLSPVCIAFPAGRKFFLVHFTTIGTGP